jgi:regulator of replication initiation timing
MFKNLIKMSTDLKPNTPTDAGMEQNLMLCAGILDVLRNDWGNRCGEFEAYWFGYEALKDQLHENGIVAEIKEIKSAMKDLSKQNKVELKETYDNEWRLCGSGWFACT